MIFSYIRTSVWKKEKITLTMQQELIHKKLDDLKLPHPLTENRFEDRGISGAKYEEREGLQQLLSRLKKETSKGSILIVYRYNRLSRNNVIMIKILEILEQNEIQLISVMEPLPSESHISLQKMIVQIYITVGQFEREVAIEDINSGLEQKRRNRKPLSPKAPFGYRYSAEKLLANDSELKIVRLIYDWYLTELYGYQKICKRLNKEGYRFQGRVFYSHDIYRILKNKTYYGVLTGGRVGGEYKGTHDPVITESEYLAVQHIKKTRHVTKKDSRYYWLRGKIACPLCNQKFTPTRKTNEGRYYSYYYCANPKCTEKSINATQTEEKVLVTIIQFITKSSILDSTLEELNKKHLKMKEEAKLARRQLSYRRERLFIQFEQGDVLHDDFIKKMNKFNAIEVKLAATKKDLFEREFIEEILKSQSGLKDKKLLLEFYSDLIERVVLNIDYSIKAIYLKNLPFNIMKQEEFVL